MAIDVDIEEISRFKDKSQKFLNKVYTKKEQEYCLSKQYPESHLAARFSAKEATIKALCALDIKISEYKAIAVYHNENKVPQIRILKELNQKLNINVRLSHDKTKSIAFVTIEKA